MIKIESVTKEMKCIKEDYLKISDIEETKEIKKQKKNLRERYNFLKVALLYLETNPREAFFSQTLKDLRGKLPKLKYGFKSFSRPEGYEGNLRSLYNKKSGSLKIKKQIKHLSFLLERQYIYQVN